MKLKTNPYLGFNDFPLMLIGIPLVGVFVPLIFFGLHVSDLILSPSYFVGSIVYTAFYWLGDRVTFIYFRKKFPDFKDYKKRILITSTLVIAYTFGFCQIGIFFINPSMDKIAIPALDNVTDLTYNVASLVSSITVGILYEAIYLLYLWRNQMVESERLKKESLRAQLETLKSQVNPHFLFNSLNTLASVIPDNQVLAVEFVQKLSKVYRYILEIKEKELVTLSEELECIEAYAFLLKIRFGENVTVCIDLNPDSKRKYIVPLSLQMLLENAIKHNIVSQKKPLKINILNGEGELIVVSNNLQLKSNKEESTKIGLENIKRRYQILTGKNVEVFETQGKFHVSLPLITADTL